MLARLRSLLDVLLRRDRFERHMREEMEFHLQARADDLEHSGLARSEAMRRARIEFGLIDSAQGDCRQARGIQFVDELTQDVRYALRLMRKTPGFTTAAILSLALGIGANTAIFSLMDAVVMRTLPLQNVEELVFLAHGKDPARAGASSNYPLFERYRSLTDVFSVVTAYSPTAFKIETGDGLENVSGLWVSGNFHAALDVEVAHGRGFSAESDRAIGSAIIAVISDSYWTRRFGRDPTVLGQPLSVDGRSVTIVGVTGPRFTGLIPGQRPDVTLPLSVRAVSEPHYLDMHDTWTDLTMVARLKPGVSETLALGATDAAFQRYMAEPENQWIRKQSAGDGFAAALLVPAARGSGVLRRQYETALRVLMGMVAMVLLIASVNVANLLLVRSSARAKEVAIRLCVGGGRLRLIRQFLTESLLLALCGGALGLLVALWGAQAIMSLFTVAEAPLLLDVSPNLRVLLFTGAVSLLTGLLFGLLPAFKSTRVNLTPALKEGGVAPTTMRRWSTSQLLVASQVALSVLVLVVAGLLVRTLYNLKTVDAGFTKGNLLLFTLDTFGTPVPATERARIYDEVLDRVRTLPGVQRVAGSRSTPIHTSGNSRALVIPPSIQLPDTPDARGAFANLVTPELFETLGIRLRRGRGFTSQDAAGGQRVAVINETMARFYADYLGHADPLGQTLSFRGDPKDLLTIVGVVQDTHQLNLRDAPLRTVYTPLAQESTAPSTMMVEIRTVQDPAALTSAARDAVRAASKDVVIRYVRTIDQQINASLVRERLLAALSSGFALLALVLSAVGLYGVVSYSVSRRAREIGIRMALGAARARVLWRVLRQTVAMSVAGVVVGAIASLAASTTLTTFMFGLSPRDPLTLVAVCVLLLVTSVAAGLVPARRASTLDPVRAIRTE